MQDICVSILLNRSTELNMKEKKEIDAQYFWKL